MDLTREQLREALREQERSARWLALKAGVTPSLLQMILRGERAITARTAARVIPILWPERSSPCGEVEIAIADTQ